MIGILFNYCYFSCVIIPVSKGKPASEKTKVLIGCRHFQGRVAQSWVKVTLGQVEL